MRKRFATLLAGLAVLVLACDNPPPHHTDTPTAPETAASEAEAWSQAYDRLLEGNPDARIFDQMMAQRFPETSRSELIRTWDAEKSRSFGRYHRREAHAIETLAEYLRAQIDGKAPPLGILDDRLDRMNWVEWGPPYFQESRDW